MNDDLDELVCINLDDGRLVFELRERLTENEQERADLHLGGCLACQIDLDVEYFLTHIFSEKDSRL